MALRVCSAREHPDASDNLLTNRSKSRYFDGYTDVVRCIWWQLCSRANPAELYEYI